MTLNELKQEYGDANVFPNQLEMGKFVQEYGIKNKIKLISERYPNELIAKDNEVLYDIAERLLSKGFAFFNDGYYIIEDLEDLKNL